MLDSEDTPGNKISLVAAVMEKDTNSHQCVESYEEVWEVINWHSKCLVTQSCPTLCNPMDCSPPGSSALGDSPGKNTEVGCHFLLQQIFLTQGLNPDLPHCRQILYHLSYPGSPLIGIEFYFCKINCSWGWLCNSVNVLNIIKTYT